jgi:hypothetical protein
MKGSVKEELKRSFIVSSGWLFADLLLALMMFFLATSTFSLPKPPPLPTSSATAAPVLSPSPTSLPTATPPHLEQIYHRFEIIIDSDRLLSNTSDARSAIIQQIKAQSFLRGRQVGLIIAYCGAPTVDDIPRAVDISTHIYDILLDLGKHDPTFSKASRYDPLYILGNDRNEVSLDLFLFAK